MQHPAPSSMRVLVAVSSGGVVGAEIRYGVTRLLPHDAAGFPFSTLLINLTGCLLLALLTAFVTQIRGMHPLIRPLLGTGLLGGFTTYSTFTLDIHTLSTAHRTATATGYLAATVAGGLLAGQLATIGARRLIARRAAPRLTS